MFVFCPFRDVLHCLLLYSHTSNAALFETLTSVLCRCLFIEFVLIFIRQVEPSQEVQVNFDSCVRLASCIVRGTFQHGAKKIVFLFKKLIFNHNSSVSPPGTLKRQEQEKWSSLFELYAQYYNNVEIVFSSFYWEIIYYDVWLDRFFY